MIKRSLALGTGLLMLGSSLVLGPSASATGIGTECREGKGRALATEKGRNIGYLLLRVRYCWEYFGSRPTKMTSAKVLQVATKMPPSDKDSCLMSARIVFTEAHTSLTKSSSLVWTYRATGYFRIRAYVDDAPRDCKLKYHFTEAWAPEVKITMVAGKSPNVSAPPVSYAVIKEHL